MDKEILSVIREKGILLDKNVLEILNSFENPKEAATFLESVEKNTGQKVITRNVLLNNVQFVKSFVNKLPGEEKEVVENVFVRLGISLEIIKEKELIDRKKEDYQEKKRQGLGYKLFYAETKPDKKLEVSDFVGNFKSRYQELQRILMEHATLQNNLMSIGKISGERSNVNVIGIVSEKRITKNKNIIFKLEDMTGSVNVLVRHDKEEVFKKAGEVLLDDVIGIVGSGNRDMIFVNDIEFPDCINHDKVYLDEDAWVVFLSDVHCGSDRHLGKSFNNFLNWLETDKELAPKIKYMFFTGDNVDGVGIFPGQENVLKLKSMSEQYDLLGSYLERVPKHITMFLCPGQHDATRVAEPQPIVSRKYASKLYDIDNLVLVTNPCMVKLIEGDKEFKVLMYHGASLHNLINSIPELREAKAHLCPAKSVKHVLKRRHLAPIHSEMVYIPNVDKDPLVISEVPDILCTGEMHRTDIDSYNGVLIVVGSCWQAKTDFEEKVGNVPDPAKVPLVNLKTREIKILDFGVPGEFENEVK